jgi:hypothetical protein
MNTAERMSRGRPHERSVKSNLCGLRLDGELVFVGDLLDDELPKLANTPSVQIQTADGRLVTITGLSREECRAVAPGLFKDVRVNIGMPNKSRTST